MSIKIHHGAPGSYKTSGAVADDFVAAVLAGRHIVTNVRGLCDAQLIRDTIESATGKDVPDTFMLDFLDTSDSKIMQQVRCWFHWIPDGCFLLLDEIQEIYPKSFRQSDINKLAFPGGADAAAAAGTFDTLELAFEKHRHKNLDFVVTTPSITKVHSAVRGSAEAAYKHKNLAIMGGLFKGRYTEGFHAADTNGKGSDFYSIIQKRIPPYVFKLYKSTSTGVVTDTTAGQSILKNPKILGLLVGFAVLVGYLVFGAPAPKFAKVAINGSAVVASPGVVAPASSVIGSPVGIGLAGAAPVGVVSPDLGRGVAPSLPARLSFLAWKGTVLARGDNRAFGEDLWRLHYVSDGGNWVDLDAKIASHVGLRVAWVTPCYAVVSYAGQDYVASCPPPPVDKPSKDGAFLPAAAGVGTGLHSPVVADVPPVVSGSSM